MKRFACCPVCAHKLCKGEKGCYLDIKCPRCGEVIHIEIGDVITTRIVSKEEREKVRAQMISQHKSYRSKRQRYVGNLGRKLPQKQGKMYCFGVQDKG